MTSKLLASWVVDNPALTSFFKTKSLNFLNPAVWFNEDTAFFHLAISTSDLIEYEKYW